jgi:hypothetical protein
MFRVSVRPVEVIMRRSHREPPPFVLDAKKAPKTTFAAILDAILSRRSVARSSRVLVRTSREKLAALLERVRSL